MADILTGGRIIFGVGRGYHSREVETLGAPMLDGDANRELFEEQIEIILKAFNEESFSHHGKHYQLPPEVPYRGYQLQELTLVPRPIHRPVEVWQPIVSGSSRGIDFMAKHGIKGFVTPTSGNSLDEWAHTYRDAAAKYGQDLDLGEGLALNFRLHLSDTTEQAIQEARAYFEEQVKFFAPLNLIPLNQSQLTALRNPSVGSKYLPTMEDSIKQGDWLCGPPEDAVNLLRDLERLRQ